MKIWIEKFQQFYGDLSWNKVAELIKKSNLDHDAYLNKKEIDIAYGTKDRNVSHVYHLFLDFKSHYFLFIANYLIHILTIS